jgi:two-component sensor histidine kinase
MHELVTNSVKYGALSNGSGRVHLSWILEQATDAPMPPLRWEERGGPTVTPPKRRGSGSKLIERSLAQELGGEVKMDFAPAG